MPRPLLYMPETEDGYTIYEITVRCIHSRYLLRPGKKENALYIGCIVKALETTNARWPDAVRLHFAGGLSNHLHLIISTNNLDALAQCKSHLFGNLSKEVGHLHNWPQRIFDRRSRTIPIAPDALDDRLMYCAAHGYKEGLTRRGQWPGVDWNAAATEGTDLQGTWIDRTAFYHAIRGHQRRKGKSRKPKISEFTTAKTLQLHPPPGWEDLCALARRARWTALVEAAHKMHPPKRTPPLGVAAILKTKPHTRPEKTKRSPAPLIHTKDAVVRRAWIKKYREFVKSYREALQGMVASGMAQWSACFARGVTPIGLTQRE